MSHNPLTEVHKGNLWYTDDQAAASVAPHQRRIIDNRQSFFLRVIRARQAAHVSTEPLKVLDAGCGDGVLLNLLSSVKGLALYGIDYNPVRIELVRERVSRVVILLGDLGTLSLRDARFDIVFASQVLEHIPDDLTVLKELVRVTCRHGWIVLGVPNEGCLFGRLRNRILQRSILSTTDHVHFYTEREVEDLVTRAGLSILERMREGFFTPHLRIHSWLMRREWGYRFLQWLGKVFPSQVAGFYFVCAR